MALIKDSGVAGTYSKAQNQAYKIKKYGTSTPIKTTTPTTTKTNTGTSNQNLVKSGSDLNGTYNAQKYVDYATKNYGVNSNVTQSWAKANPSTTINTNLDPTYKVVQNNDVGGNYDYSGSSSGITANTNYYNDLMEALMQQNEAARQSALDAIMSNLDAVKGTYKNQIQQVMNEYNNLVNENEVKKARAKQTIKESQANRGQLDGGMGKEERLNLNMGYDAITNDLKSQREQAVQEIYNLIAQAEADANTQKANVNNTYNNNYLESLLANIQ